MKTAEPESHLLKWTASVMAAKLRQREISSIELVETHIDRIQQTHESLNAVVVPLFGQARRDAEAADKALSSNVDLGPLHGVPITIKELFDVAGTVTTAGIVSPHTRPAKSDAVTVAKLRAAGAVILGKTNVPQLGVAIESDNPVYGRTKNPLDLERSSGGSSGGESAAIAAFGSPLGLGSDGGGSIRVPSHFTGICGLKPTAGRLSMKGHWLLPSFPPGWSTPGPMARSVADLQLAMHCLTTPHPSDDPYVPQTTIADMAEIDVSKLRIGFYDDDQFVRPSPAVRRAVLEAKNRLESAGATLLPFEPPPLLDAWKVQLGLLYADGGRWLKRLLGTSPIAGNLKKTLLNASLPTVVRRALPSIMESVGQKTVAQLLRLSRHKQHTAFRYQQILIEQEKLRRAFLRRWQQHELDALICPPFPSVAMKHESPDIVMGIGYTFLFNLLGMPAGVVPISHVNDGEESERQACNDDLVRELIRAEEGSAGLPVGVQVVGAHWREDVVLAVMDHVGESPTSR